MIELSIVMPAFNEELNLDKVINRCSEYLYARGLTGEIIVVNDGSTDGTGETLEKLKLRHECLVVLTNDRNSGYGFSLQRAIQASRGALVATMDSDGQFEVYDLDNLLPLIKAGSPVATGFRIKKQDSIGRVVADRVLNLIMRGLFGLNLRDTNCALKLYQGSILKTITIEANGYPTPTELLVKLSELGHQISEAPVSHHERLGGQSALKPFRTGLRMLAFLIYLRLKLSLFRRKIIRAI